MKKEAIKCRVDECSNQIEIGHMICDDCKSRAIAEIKKAQKCPKTSDGKHRLKPIAVNFDGDKTTATYQCKCGFTKQMNGIACAE